MTTQEKNKLIAEFVGYYQPRETKGSIFSFEVYASLKECRYDFPDSYIDKYTGNDIEEFEFADEADYDKDWGLLMPVVEKIESLLENSISVKIEDDNCMITTNDVDELDRNYFHVYSTLDTKIESTYEAIIKFIEWYNNVKQ